MKPSIYLFIIIKLICISPTASTLSKKKGQIMPRVSFCSPLKLSFASKTAELGHLIYLKFLKPTQPLPKQHTSLMSLPFTLCLLDSSNSDCLYRNCHVTLLGVSNGLSGRIWMCPDGLFFHAFGRSPNKTISKYDHNQIGP